MIDLRRIFEHRAPWYDDARTAGEKIASGCVLCLGTFDGVHLGHQAVLLRGRTLADQLRLPLWVLSFHPHPKTVVQPDKAPLLLTEPEERVDLLTAYGADAVVLQHFDSVLARTPAEDFLNAVVLGYLNAQAVVVGADFGFGHKREGNPESLQSWGVRVGRRIDIVEFVVPEGVTPVSSSTIRDSFVAGDCAKALRLLGHPYPVSGEVIAGAGRGKQIGYPTWNLALSDAKLPPPVGIYAGWTHRPTPQPAMAYYGTNPTFGEEKARFEVHVLDGGDDDHSPQKPVERFWITEYIRPEVRFAATDELVRQLAEDERVVRSRLLQTENRTTARANTVTERSQ